MIVGGSACGALTNDHLGCEGAQVVAAAVASDTIRFHPFVQSLAGMSELDAGRALGSQLRRAGCGQAPLLLMYELVKHTTPHGPNLNMGTPLLEGIEEQLGEWPDVAGLGLLGGVRWRPGQQFVPDGLATQTAMALSISGPVTMTVGVTTSMGPMSSYREITAVDGPAVLGIDGRPALTVIEEMLGPTMGWKDFPLVLTFGINNGDLYDTYREDRYANYLCVAVDPSRKALIMSDTYLAAGMTFQLMRRQMNFDAIRRFANSLVESVGDRRPLLALYIDCAGRASQYIGGNREEAAEIQHALGTEIPLIGVYSGSEIARVGKSVRRLNHAGVLAILSEPR